MRFAWRSITCKKLRFCEERTNLDGWNGNSVGVHIPSNVAWRATKYEQSISDVRKTKTSHITISSRSENMHMQKISGGWLFEISCVLTHRKGYENVKCNSMLRIRKNIPCIFVLLKSYFAWGILNSCYRIILSRLHVNLILIALHKCGGFQGCRPRFQWERNRVGWLFSFVISQIGKSSQNSGKINPAACRSYELIMSKVAVT